MKRLRLSLITTCALTVLNGAAIPALKQWRTIVQPDGSSIELMLVGDEKLHYYLTHDDVPVVTEDGVNYCYAATTSDGVLICSGVLAHEAGNRNSGEITEAQTAANNKPQRARRSTPNVPRRRVVSATGEFVGSRRAVVILAQFSDKSFTQDAAEFYDAMLNQHGFSTGGAAGSVNDYFSDMSRGTFDLKFDIYGPVRVSERSTYYGGPSPLFGGFDYAGDLITEAIDKADASFDIDWTVYDWDNDGEVEQVFVLYAGYGQATGGPTGTIWPHAWTLDEAYSSGAGGRGGVSRDGVYINRYACGNELYNSSGNTRMGMGVFCHEFSHCMGLPDMYDTSYGGNYGMGNWDLLDHGSYNGPNGIGECPAAWTSYERHFAGWLDYSELLPRQSVVGMKALTQADGQAYIIRNDAHPDEYYLLENRQHESWDRHTPESGLLIIHVDYEPILWENNVVNTNGTFTMADGYTANFSNDHPRMTPIHKLRSLSEGTYYDTYPIVSSKLNIDSLTDSSKPAAGLYNANTDGSMLMHKPLTHIIRNSDGTISFVYMEGQDGLRGDVNGDGRIDVDDLNLLVNMVLELAEQSSTADLTGDDKVDIDDINALITIILTSDE